MKIYISADIEGVTGTTDWNEVTKNRDEYAEFQRQMTREVKAACEGAFEAGATEIIIKDAHSTARNIIAADLPENTKLIRGWSRHPYLMMQELDQTFHAVMMIGYHAMAGCGGNPLSHTLNSSLISSVEINGKRASEFLINTMTSSLEHVPVVFLSGDEDVCDEAENCVSGITTVAVKKGTGGSTINLHPREAERQIKKRSCQALKKDPLSTTYNLPDFFSVKIDFTNIRDGYRASFYPGMVRVSDRSVLLETKSYFDILRMLSFVG